VVNNQEIVSRYLGYQRGRKLPPVFVSTGHPVAGNPINLLLQLLLVIVIVLAQAGRSITSKSTSLPQKNTLFLESPIVGQPLRLPRLPPPSAGKKRTAKVSWTKVSSTYNAKPCPY
jgi:hypothetical protein